MLKVLRDFGSKVQNFEVFLELGEFSSGWNTHEDLVDQFNYYNRCSVDAASPGFRSGEERFFGLEEASAAISPELNATPQEPPEQWVVSALSGYLLLTQGLGLDFDEVDQLVK